MMQNFGSGNPSFSGVNPNFQNFSVLNPRAFDLSGSACGYGPQCAGNSVADVVKLRCLRCR